MRTTCTIGWALLLLVLGCDGASTPNAADVPSSPGAVSAAVASPSPAAKASSSAAKTSSAPAAPSASAFPSDEAACAAFAAFEKKHFSEGSYTWFHWLTQRSKIERKPAWCAARKKAAEGILDDLRLLQARSRKEDHVKWTGAAVGHLETRVKLIGELCEMFAKPVETEEEKAAREKREAGMRFKVAGEIEYRAEEYKQLDKLGLADGKIGYVMPSFTLCKE